MFDIGKYEKTWEFVREKHKGQTFGGRWPGEQVPYIHHLASVAMEVIWGVGNNIDFDLDFAITLALLHDTVEDTGTTYEEILALYDQKIADGVMALSKIPSVGDRKAQMADSLRRISQSPSEVQAVKLADRITNLYHPPFYWDRNRIHEYLEESQLILCALGSVSDRLKERLSIKIIEYRFNAEKTGVY